MYKLELHMYIRSASLVEINFNVKHIVDILVRYIEHLSICAINLMVTIENNVINGVLSEQQICWKQNLKNI